MGLEELLTTNTNYLSSKETAIISNLPWCFTIFEQFECFVYYKQRCLLGAVRLGTWTDLEQLRSVVINEIRRRKPYRTIHPREAVYAGVGASCLRKLVSATAENTFNK